MTSNPIQAAYLALDRAETALARAQRALKVAHNQYYHADKWSSKKGQALERIRQAEKGVLLALDALGVAFGDVNEALNKEETQA